MNLWLDDERNPKDKYIQSEFGADDSYFWVKTARDAINILKNGNVKNISLDHDLGPNAGTGLEVANWIEQQAFLGNIEKLSWSVHSMNPVGSKNMIKALEKADEFWAS
ncbi:MAG: cyclic-phosphate processing receiver domain-containing protein [bacterium]